mmetsp:Transcript_23226/g.64944  ORF Transcript_23226/g.64944 Transcript_23226/m.64944 type:complete len:476 (+) Transcript_23226:113-1540(+)
MSLLLVLGFAWALRARAETATGECLMGAQKRMPVCELIVNDTSHIAPCCAAAHEMNALGCFCNPTVLALDGGSFASSLPLLQGLCGIPDFECQSHTSMGCPGKTDEEVDAERFSKLLEFQAAMTAGAMATDLDGIRRAVSMLEAVFTRSDGSDAILHSSGLGLFSKASGVSEYFAFSFPYVAQQLPLTELTNLSAGFHEMGRFGAGYDFGCNRILTRSIFPTPAGDFYTSMRMDFDPCSAELSDVKIYYPDKALTEIIEAVSTKPSIGETVCDAVMLHCSQFGVFPSKEACIGFWDSLPAVDPACRHATIGNSQTCRLKHHYLMPLSPELHCFHVANGSLPDVEGNIKCVTDACPKQDADFERDFGDVVGGNYGGYVPSPDNDHGVTGCEAVEEPMTCGQVKEIYKSSHCCGNPSKPIAMPPGSRRLSVSARPPPGALVEAVRRHLREVESERGPRASAAAAKKIEAAIGAVVPN